MKVENRDMVGLRVEGVCWVIICKIVDLLFLVPRFFPFRVVACINHVDPPRDHCFSNHFATWLSAF